MNLLTFQQTTVKNMGSMSLVSRPVSIGGKRFLDGGISDPLPLAAFQAMGYERNMVVLTQPLLYVKVPMGRSLPLWRYPGIADAMSCTMESGPTSEKRRNPGVPLPSGSRNLLLSVLCAMTRRSLCVSTRREGRRVASSLFTPCLRFSMRRIPSCAFPCG